MDAGAHSLNFRDFLDALKRENESELLSLAMKHGHDFPYALWKDNGGNNALHLVAKKGKTIACNFLLTVLGFDINSTNNDGNTPLFRASWKGHVKTAQYLVQQGADITRINNMGGNLLHSAAKLGEAELIKILLNHNVNPNSNSPVYGSPLIHSIYADSIECMELLLQARANPNIHCYQHKMTPLGLAAYEMKIEMIECLLRYGANPNMLDKTGTKAIEYAAKCNFHAGVKLLFPITSRIEGYPDWSICEIRNVSSGEARQLRKVKMDELFEQKKQEGDKALKCQNYEGAIHWYTQAIEADPTSAAVFCSRSLCWFRLNVSGAALADAKACIELRPHMAMGHFREGKAWMALENYQQAAEAFSKALALEPRNAQIQEQIQAAHRKAQQAGHNNG